MRTRRNILKALGTALCLVSWGVAHASPASPATGTASLRGVVTHVDDGMLLHRVSVTLRSETNHGFIRVRATDRDGAFGFEELPAGVYSLEATRDGFERFTLEPLLLLDDTVRNEHISLRATPVPARAS